MIEFRTVIAETRKVALRHPLTANEDTAYFNPDGSPCCIFGHVFDRLGVSLPKDANTDSLSELNWEYLGFDHPNHYEQDWVCAVQTQADLYTKWALSVGMADVQLANAA